MSLKTGKMAKMAEKKALWRKDEIDGRERAFAQRLNPASFYHGAYMSRLAGMKRAHVTRVRLPPGKDSFAYHAHLVEEEWVYIISGTGVAEIDGEETTVGPGDFMGFATPGVAHLLKNTSSEELVYLMGGENQPLDVIEYPKLGKRYLLMPGANGVEFYELKDPTMPFGRVPEEAK
jgi:uncharacterized cupin superfamily protein